MSSRIFRISSLLIFSFFIIFFSLVSAPTAAHAQNTCTDSIGCAGPLRAQNGTISYFPLSSVASFLPSGIAIGSRCYECNENGNSIEPDLILNSADTFNLEDANGNITGTVTGPGTFGPYLAADINQIIEIPTLFLYTDINPQNVPDPTRDIDVSWTTTSPSPATDGITYYLYRSASATGLATAKAVPIVPTLFSSNDYYFVDIGLTPDTTYYYKLQGRYTSNGNASLNGDYTAFSNISSITTGSGATPTGPADLTAIPMGTSTISLSWTKAQNDPNLGGYIVYRSLNRDMSQATPLTYPNTTGNTFTDTTVLPAITYYYQVNSYAPTAPGGIEPNAASNVASAEIVIPAPILISLFSETTNPGTSDIVEGSGFSSGTTIQLTDASTSAAYALTDTSYDANEGDLIFKIPQIPSGSYILRAYNPDSSWSNSLMLEISDAPTNLTANISLGSGQNQNGVALNWTNNDPDAIGFNIERAEDDSDYFTRIGTVSAASTTYVDTMEQDDPSGDPPSLSDSYRVNPILPGGESGDYSDMASLSPCSLISGDASAPDKIVFVKGDGLNMSGANFLSTIQDVVQNGYLVTDPFKTYAHQLSFYVDTVPFPQASLGKKGIDYDSFSNAEIVNHSNCGPLGFEYAVFFGDPGLYLAWSYEGSRVFFENMADKATLMSNGTPTEEDNENLAPGQIALDAIHESGHAIGYLTDEYYTPESQGDDEDIGKNCSVKPYLDFQDTLNGQMYGSVSLSATSTQGCATYNYANPTEYAPVETAGVDVLGDDILDSLSYIDVPVPQPYYRPSTNSVMGENFPAYEDGTPVHFYNQYNVISCGYLVAAILGEPIDHIHAQLHWPVTDSDPAALTALGYNPPGCDSPLMNTTKDGIPSINPIAPGPVQSISVSTVTPGTPPNTITP